jgi:hypothetical protein
MTTTPDYRRCASLERRAGDHFRRRVVRREVAMRTRYSVARLLLLALVVASAIPATASRGPIRQSAIVYLAAPTLIGGTIVQGPVMFVHDEARMARGEPCTSVHLFDPVRGAIEEITAFHCIPTARPIVSAFTLRTRPNVEVGYGCVLTEYQFAGDAEGHGVPAPRLAE